MVTNALTKCVLGSRKLKRRTSQELETKLSPRNHSYKKKLLNGG